MTLPKTKQPKKQRKRLYTAPLHRRIKMMTAPLSHELRSKYGVRRLPVRQGDRVTVFQNKHADDEIKGRVIKVLPKKYAIHIESFSKEKADGTIVSFPVHPSNVVIVGLNLKDKKRRELIKRKSTKEITDEDFEESIFETEEEETSTTVEEETEGTEEEEFEEFEEIEDEDEEESE